MSFKKAILVGAVTSSVITTTAMGMTHFYARSGRDGARFLLKLNFLICQVMEAMEVGIGFIKEVV